MRIDLYLFESGKAKSRTEAKRLILNGDVKVNGIVVNKPSAEFFASDSVEVDSSIQKFVSRGGFKLEAALDCFDVITEGRLAIDIGASTGGFTDCLLKRGVSRVITVDSGSMQLSDSIREDSRVLSYENYNARYLKASDFPYMPQLAVMDVSFISATYIIPSLYEILSDNSDFICLVKPQFEVGRENIDKGGIVKSEKKRKMALCKVVDFARSVGFLHIQDIESPIRGGDGNIEYLSHFKKLEWRKI